MTNLQQILISGGDCRLQLQDNLLNDVYVSPLPHDNLIQRSSCTGSYLTSKQLQELQKILIDIEQNKTCFSSCMQNIHESIKKILQLKEDVAICTISSGTDAEYIPLWILQNIVDQNATITNIVCGTGELGSNSSKAASGCYFKNLTPSGSLVCINEHLLCKNKIEMIALKREVITNKEEISMEICHKIIHNRLSIPGKIVLLHILEPSKLGYRMDILKDLISLQQKYKERLFFVVDACQSRTSLTRLHEYLDKQCFVLITGAKFPEGLPFSGAVLIPSKITQKCNSLTKVKTSPGLHNFISQYDVSDNLKPFRSSLKKWENLGLMLRWKCALSNWSLFFRIDSHSREKIINDWLFWVVKIIKKYDNIEFFCGGEEQIGSIGNRNTIISFKLLYNDKPLDKCSLRDIRCAMLYPVNFIFTNDPRKQQALNTSFFVGQPVELAKFSIIRVAIGALLVHKIKTDGLQKVLLEDELLFLKLSLITENYSLLKKNILENNDVEKKVV